MSPDEPNGPSATPQKTPPLAEMVTRNQAKAQGIEIQVTTKESPEAPLTRSKFKKTQSSDDYVNKSSKLLDGKELYSKGTKRKKPSDKSSETGEEPANAEPEANLKKKEAKPKKKANSSQEAVPDTPTIATVAIALPPPVKQEKLEAPRLKEDTKPRVKDDRPTVAKLKEDKPRNTPGPKRKKRNGSDDIVKKFFCKFSGCNKAYTSYAAASEHYRSKHQEPESMRGDRDEDEYTHALNAPASEANRWPIPVSPEFPTPTAWQAKYMSFRLRPETLCSYVYLHHTRQHVVSLLNQLNTDHTILNALLNKILCERLQSETPPEQQKEPESETGVDQPQPVQATPAGETAQTTEAKKEKEKHFDIPVNPHWVGDYQQEPTTDGPEKVPLQAISVSLDDKGWQSTEAEERGFLDGDMKERHNIKMIRSFTELSNTPEVLELKSKNPLLEFKISYLNSFFESEKRSIGRLIASLEDTLAANLICFSSVKGLQSPNGGVRVFQLREYRQSAMLLQDLLDKRLGQALESLLISEPISKRDVLNIWIVSSNGEYYPSYERQESLAFFCNLLPKQITSALSNWRMRHKPLVEVYDKKIFKEQAPIIVKHYCETQSFVASDLFSKVCAIVANFSYLHQIPITEPKAFELIDLILDQFYEVCDETTTERDVNFFELFSDFSKSLLVLHLLTCHRANMYLYEYMRCICENDPQCLALRPIHQRLRYGEQLILMRPSDVSEKSMPRKVFSHKHFSAKSVNYLKSWLKVNVDDPYPTKREYEKLAEATGLSESQVRDWFVNARRRLIEGPKPSPSQGRQGQKRKSLKAEIQTEIEPTRPTGAEEDTASESGSEEANLKRKNSREDSKIIKKQKK